ncbi:uncharacterized protein LOC142362806 [Opisthocomus hoazin]|uniref:uncharacterized protein LOC142362806 n=1 Tax=Opisthocomus hoazin TaxID=30419 RepID=UPI003F52B25D
MTLASKHEVPLTEKDVADLLLWGQRRNIFPSVEEVFDDQCWNALEKDLWESVTAGNRDAVPLSQIWPLVSQLLRDTKTESKVMQAAKQALSAEWPSIPALPVDARDFFGSTVPPAPLLEEGDEDMEILLDPKHVPLPERGRSGSAARWGGVNIGSMGSTVSVLEKAAQKSLPELADRANVKLTEGEISGLLLWYRRRKLIATTDWLFDLDVWQRIGFGRQQRGAIISPCFSSCQKHDQLKGTKAQLKDFAENFERTKSCSFKSLRKSLLGNQCIQL